MALTFTSIFPANGSTAGGTFVEIIGTGFDAAQPYVDFGGVMVYDITWIDDTHLTCLTPAHAAGLVSVDLYSNAFGGGAVLTPNAYEYITPPVPGTVSKESLELAPSGFKVLITTANNADVTNIKGPYIWQSDAPFTLSADTSATTTSIVAGKSYKFLTLSSNNIPAGPGYLVFDYGQNDQEGPIKYLYKITESIVAIDPSYTFQQFHSIGTSVVAVSKMGPHTPTGHGNEYPPYVTNPSDARKQLQDLINSVTSAGIFIDFIIRYPNQLYGTLSVYD